MSGEPSLTRAALLKIYEHARAEFPKECCGYIYGLGENAEVVPCVNRQDQLHELDPEIHPRTSAEAYNIGGKELLTMIRSFNSDRPVTIVYHSHPRVGAYFSAEDTRAAQASGYPVRYLVVDAQDDEIREAKLFDGQNDAEEYVEVERFEGAKI